MNGRQAAELNEQIGRKLPTAISKTEAGDVSGAIAAYNALEELTEDRSLIASFRLFGTACLIDHGRMKRASERFSTVDPALLGTVHQVEYEYLFARLLAAKGEYADALKRTESTLRRVEQIPVPGPLILMTVSRLITLKEELLPKSEAETKQTQKGPAPQGRPE